MSRSHSDLARLAWFRFRLVDAAASVTVGSRSE